MKKMKQNETEISRKKWNDTERNRKKLNETERHGIEKKDICIDHQNNNIQNGIKP